MLIGELLKEKDNIVLEAPTGSGKSDIAMTICDALAKQKIGTQKAIIAINPMAQYKNDFPELKELKEKEFRLISNLAPQQLPNATVKNFKCPVDAFQDGKRFYTSGIMCKSAKPRNLSAILARPGRSF